MHTNTRSRRPSRYPRSVFERAGLGLALLMSLPALAQSGYTLVDLSPTGYGVAKAVGGGLTGGYTSGSSAGVAGRAAVWSGGGLTDFHPPLA